MRTALLAALVIVLGAPAGAQSHGARAHEPDRSTDEVFHPSIGLPLPQIGLPLPPIGLPPPSMNLPPRPTERSERPHRSIILFGPVYGWPYPYPYVSGTSEPSLPSPAPPPAPHSATGRLHLDLQSDVDPRIYVDGYYVGLLSDANGGELTLDAGAHTIELRQEGYETLREGVRIPFDDVITYRAALKPLAAPPAPIAVAPAPPPAPTTIYVIPGCYVGNVAPREAALPAGCDPNRAVAFPPQQ